MCLKTNRSIIRKFALCNSLIVDNEYVLPPSKTLPAMYARILNWFSRDIIGIHTIKKRKYDLTIATKQLLVPALVDVLYEHFPDFIPDFAYLHNLDRHLYNTLLRIYLMAMKSAMNLLITLFKNLRYKPFILTNSRFTASIVRRFLGVIVSTRRC